MSNGVVTNSSGGSVGSTGQGQEAPIQPQHQTVEYNVLSQVRQQEQPVGDGIVQNYSASDVTITPIPEQALQSAKMPAS